MFVVSEKIQERIIEFKIGERVDSDYWNIEDLIRGESERE